MIAVRIRKQFRPAPADSAKLKTLVRTICRRFEVRQATVSIAILGDAEITRLNRKFLNHEGTTDSLSFDLSDNIDPQEPRAFELIVNGELALREAARRGHAPEAELALYVAHGLLHNLGFDDNTPARARKMHQIEDEILQHLGYGFVYNSDGRAR